MPSHPHPNPLPQGEREPEVTSAHGVIAKSTVFYLLRPLTGATDEVVAVHIGMSNLISGSLPEERVRPTAFPPPSGDDLADPADGIEGT